MTTPEASKAQAPSPAAGGMPIQLVRPSELKRIADEKEQAAVTEALERRAKLDQQHRDLYKEFTERHLRPDADKRFSEAVRQAAERGEREVQVLRFPSAWCTDRGRAINNTEPDWPQTLTGFAKESFEAFDKWLKPMGYKMRAEILDFPGGMPGDIGLFIGW